VDPRVFVELLIKEIDKGVRDGLIDCHEFIKAFAWHPLGEIEARLTRP
jgi:hypothetical protein